MKKNVPKKPYQYQMLINGKWTESVQGKRMERTSPAHDIVVSQYPEATEEDVDSAVNAARKAGYYCIRFDPYDRFDPVLENDKAKSHPELKKKIEKYAQN